MRTMSVQQLLEVVRAHPGTLPQAVAGHLLCAAVARAASSRASLRPRLVLLDAAQGVVLDLTSPPSAVAEFDAGYVAPEALIGSVQPDDPPVLVYAAGALGYHLLTAEAPPPLPDLTRPELASPLGEIVRAALAPHPRDRIPRLEEMGRALQVVHPSPGPAIERQLVAAVLACCSRWEDDTAAGQLRAAAAEGSGARLSPAQMARWARELDAALDARQRQQLDLVLALASREGGASTGRPAPGEDRVARIGEQIDLLQRIVQLSPSAATASGSPARRSPLLRWLVPAALGAAAALGASRIPNLRVVQALLHTQPEAREAHEVRPAEPPQAASSGRTIVASPIVLSAPAAESDEGSAEGRQASNSPQATRGPATPRPSAPAKLSTPKLPDASEDELLEKGEVALHLGRAAEALAAFRAVLDAHPDLAPAVRGVGLAYLMQRREAEAKAQLERYLQLAPDAEDAGRMRRLVSGLAGTPPRR
ncbi:MAG TPA: hypothetical protein VMK66_08885 [Myxococcales bacterium]|nr:hypothetical protein [Myxococcales bacterium]